LYYFYDVSCPNNGSERVIGWPGDPFEELEEVKFKECRLLFAARGKLMFTIPY